MWNDDWNIDHIRWSKRCPPKDGQHYKKRHILQPSHDSNFYLLCNYKRLGNTDLDVWKFKWSFCQVDAASIEQYSLEFTTLEFFPLAFKPIIDDFSVDPFVPKEPWDMIESGDFSQVNYGQGFKSWWHFCWNRAANYIINVLIIIIK